MDLGHLALHLDDNKKSRIFIDDTTKTKEARNKSLKEQEANNKAEEVLLQEDIFEYFSNQTNYLTDEKVTEFAKAKKLHPSIVVGILAFNEMASYSTLHRF